MAALAITMDRISETDPLRADFKNAELTVIPTAKGKKVIQDDGLKKKRV